MADDIIRNLSSIKLSDEEADVIVANYDLKVDDGKGNQVKLLLIAKYFNPETPHFPRLCASLQNLWSLREGFTIRELGDRLYAIQFFNQKDQDKVMMGRLWNFNNSLLCLQHACPLLLPHELVFYDSPFWVRFFNVPLGYQTPQFADILGNAFGYFFHP